MEKKRKISREEFMKVFEEIKEELIRDLPTEFPSDIHDHLKEMFEYTVPHGKLNRGMAVVSSYVFLCEHHVNENEMRKACIIGWAIEFLQAFMLVADDIMDGSEYRRGNPCWYKINKIGMSAINDSLILESSVFSILEKYFSTEKYYGQLISLFHKVILQTEMGQLLDLKFESSVDQLRDSESIDLSLFTHERYSVMSRYKTGYYSFYLPVACALLLNGTEDSKVYKCAESILIKMGEYFQVQDDYLDAFGDPNVTGKVGTDIVDCKCSWMICEALARANDSQREILKKAYGTEEERVKEVFSEIGLLSIYTAWEKNAISAIEKEIEEQSLIPHSVLFSVFDVIKGRKS